MAHGPGAHEGEQDVVVLLALIPVRSIRGGGGGGGILGLPRGEKHAKSKAWKGGKELNKGSS